MRNLLLIVVVVLLVLLAIIVGARNTETITVNYLIAQTNMQVSTFMVITIGLGMLIGSSIVFGKYLTWRVKYTVLQRKFDKLSQRDIHSKENKKV